MAKDIESLQARVEELVKDKYDLLSIKTKEGLLASEWLMRTARAEASVAELERQVEAMRPVVQAVRGWKSGWGLTKLMTAVDEYERGEEVQGG